MILIELLYEFLKIGAFSFGGGMSTLPYIYEMANNTGWISEDVISNLLSVTQVTPGPIACNIGTIVGYKVCGILGAIATNIGFIIPAIIFMGISYRFYNIIQKNEKIIEIIKIVRSASLALIIISSLTIIKMAFFNDFETSSINIQNFYLLVNYKSIILAIVLSLLYKKKQINSLIFILISAGISGIIGI